MDTPTIECVTARESAPHRPAPSRRRSQAQAETPPAETAATANRAFVGIDRRGRITLANDAFRRVFGFSPPAGDGRVPLSRYVPLLTPPRLAHWAVRPGGTSATPCPPLLAEAHAADGSVFLVAVTLTPASVTPFGPPDAPAGVVTLQPLETTHPFTPRTEPAGSRTDDPVPVGALLEDLLDGLPHADDRLRCHLGVRSEEHRIAADPSAVQAVLKPVIDNACRYSAADTPVSIRIRHEAADPDEAGAPAGYVVVSVADRGCGMTRAEQQRAFEPFWRAPSAGGLPGAGLGLAIARRLADAQGGWIELRSAAGLGTEVDVWFPAAPRPH